MNIFDFLTQEQLDDAPEDPALAFVHLVGLAQARLNSRLREFNPAEEADSYEMEDARYGFINTVVGLARAYDIQPFSTMTVPRIDDYNRGYDRQFRADIDHYLAQIVVGNTLRVKRDSFHVPDATKSRIRSHLHYIKEEIDKAEMADGRREALLKKLAEFEAALERNRLNLLAVTRFVFEVLSVSCNVLALADSATFQKLLMNVIQTTAEAKAADDENRKLPLEEPVRLILPPRPARPREDFSADLDDEIPF